MTKEIPLTRGKVALVDDDDYEWLMQWKWQVSSTKTDTYASGWIGRRPDRRRVLMHRKIMKEPSGCDVIHENGNTLDNRKNNLRVREISKPKTKNKRFNSLSERFWSKVRIGGTSECWEWIASSRFPTGYGNFPVKGDDGKYHSHNASRIAYELTHGSIPDGKLVCHSCDNPSCCNPAHLWLGTAKDNQVDMSKKLRSLVGEKSPNAILTEQQVINIRREYSNGDMSILSLSKRYNVGATTIDHILKRRSWKHI